MGSYIGELPVGYYGNTRVLLWRVIPPILITVGTIGNTTSINHLSSWLIVAITVERTACVLFPHKVRLGCSPRNAGLIIVAIVLAVFGINIIAPVIIGVHENNGSKYCGPSKVNSELLHLVYLWIDSTLSFGAPFPLLLTGIVIIVVQLARFRSRLQRMSISGQARDTRPLSMLIIALCVMFFLTMTPRAVIFVYNRYRIDTILALWALDPYTALYEYQYLWFLSNVFELVSYFNNTFNFVFYVFSGSKLRTELQSVLCSSATQFNSLLGS
ncbi:uncharacterized protein LOC127835903 [Dreissena polymorpha]|nr:uncharacterized protein LOC127835903 [Dreissena polymorpha]